VRVATGLLLGYAADRLLGDPRHFHPVAGFGRIAMALEAHTHAPSRVRGVVHVGALVGGATAAGMLVDHLAGRVGDPGMGRDIGRVAITAVATWAVLGGRSLEREALTIQRQLAAGDLDAARRQVRNLVGRDPSRLSADEVARATVESVAENGADALVAPLWWGAVAGVPGLVAYRAINTLDAMIGHRSPRYREFGWAAARLDDLANWIPARLTVLSTAAATGSVAGVRRVLMTVARDAPAHPSPNAGPVEAAFAAALGVSLGGSNSYAGVIEDRGRLGDGPAVTVDDLRSAVRLERRIGLIALGVIVAARRAAARRVVSRRRARRAR
jgi:adenosylcobinamide-phosphate synthase